VGAGEAQFESARTRAVAAGMPVVRRAWPYLPVAFAVVYFALLLSSLGSIAHAIYLGADTASGAYMGELSGQAPAGAQIVLGNYAWFTTLWFEELTRWLPHHHQLWEIGPWLLSLTGIGLVAWSGAKAAGRWTGTMVAVVLACASPGLLQFQFAGNAHTPSFATVALLGAFLVWCAQRGGLAGRPVAHVLCCAVLAAIAGVGFASDELVGIAGIAPMMLSGFVLAWLLASPAGWRIAASTTAIGAAAIAAGLVVRHAVEAAKVTSVPLPISFATWDRIAPNARLAAHGLAYLFNGYFAGARVEKRSLLALACAVLILTGAAVAARFGWRWLRDALAGAMTRQRPAAGRPAALAAYTTFWLLTGVLTTAAFVLSTAPVDEISSRYLLSVGYAIVALVPLAALAHGSLGRGAVVAGACVLALAGIGSLKRHDVQANGRASSLMPIPGPLLRLARAEDVRYGYAGYGVAAPLSWEMKSAVQLYPVAMCGSTLCPVRLHRISSWYVPRPRTRSMLIVDPADPAYVTSAAPPGPPVPFGRPDRVARIGPVTVYVYPYDIAARFGS